MFIPTAISLLAFSIISVFYANSYGFETTIFYNPICVKTKPIDVLGMATFYTVTVYDISLIPFLIAFKYYFIAAYYSIFVVL